MSHDDSHLHETLLDRERFLRAVVDDVRTKRDLTDIADVSRSTVDRAVRELLDAGLIRKGTDGYEATLTGRTALETTEAFHRRVAGIDDAAGVLNQLPPDAPIDAAFLDGADVYTASPEMPDSVVQRLFESVEASNRLRGVAPVILAGHLETFYERALAGGATVEMLIGDAVIDRMVRTASTRSVLLSQLENESVTLRRADIPFSFGLWIADDEAGTLVHSETGVVGLLVNDTDEALSWAESLYEEVRASAAPITAAGLESDSESDSASDSDGSGDGDDAGDDSE